MKRIISLFAALLMLVCVFAGCGKKKLKDDASSMESKVSDITSGIQSDVSSFGSQLMPSTSSMPQ